MMMIGCWVPISLLTNIKPGKCGSDGDHHGIGIGIESALVRLKCLQMRLMECEIEPVN